ncbi:hypothetical protein [Streptomyces sp. NBC_01361]|uniref:hypothetical protein n=1 Tax=Streptomyces sp. NBC_01361 TaxID=2903838 RepID=UPI002E344189|nr:hypothetical protein [Streptomyces sp. NBC_01361]
MDRQIACMIEGSRERNIVGCSVVGIKIFIVVRNDATYAICRRVSEVVDNEAFIVALKGAVIVAVTGLRWLLDWANIVASIVAGEVAA